MSNRLSELINGRLRSDPESVAFIHDERRTSVADFDDQVDRTAAWLAQRGIGHDDKVAVWLVNCVEWLALLFALGRIGAVAVSVNTRYRGDEVEHLLKTSGAKLLITHGQYRRIDFLNIVSSIAPERVPQLREIALVGARQAGNEGLAWPLVAFDTGACTSAKVIDASDADQLVVLFSTSGTTKAPKLVMHPQRTLVDHARRCAVAYRLGDEGACLLAMLPFCGVFGLNSALAGFAAGAPVVLQDTFEASAAAGLMQQHNVTHTFGSDEMYRRLCEVSAEERPFPSARFFGFGAFTSSFSDFAKEAWRRGLPLHGLYGSSEVLALFSAQPDGLALDEMLEGGGRPVAGEEASIRVRNVATGELVPQGVSGEIEIKAPSNFIGYYGDPEATEQAVVDGYFRTGDLGHLRNDGTFVFETRLGDAMRLGGHLVSPLEIEEAIKQLPFVCDGHVVAATIGGQSKVAAFVIPNEGWQPNAESITQPLRQSMASFKVPSRVWFVEEFPQIQGANGAKTSRVKLREMAQQRIDAENDAAQPQQEPK